MAIVARTSVAGTTAATATAMRRIKAVVFDMDGTLCIPQPWMFPAMRKAVGLDDPKMDTLLFIDNLPTAEAREHAHAAIWRVEEKAMGEMQPQPGLQGLMSYLTIHGYSKSILTRNERRPVDHLISNFLTGQDIKKFDYIVTREFKPTKPAPDPLLYIAGQLRLQPMQILMVGDSIDDMRCGRVAGCVTLLLKNNNNKYLLSEHAELVDFAVDRLDHIPDILEQINR